MPRPARGGGDLIVTEVSQAGAVFHLLGAARIAGWRPPHILRSQFLSVSRLATTVPVLEAEIPFEAGFPGELPSRLLEQVERFDRVVEARS
jgi:hypothetical protein